MLGSLVWRLNNELTSRGARSHRYADELGHTFPIPTGESTHPIRSPCRKNPAFSSSLPATTTYDQISSLNYLSHVTSEVLRLYSPVCVIPLVATGHSFRRTHPPRSPRSLFDKAYSVSASPGPSLHNVSSSAKKILLLSEKTRSRKIINNHKKS